MLNKKSVDDINVKGKKVLVRCDFNVPLKAKGRAKAGTVVSARSRTSFRAAWPGSEICG